MNNSLVTQTIFMRRPNCMHDLNSMNIEVSTYQDWKLSARIYKQIIGTGGPKKGTGIL